MRGVFMGVAALLVAACAATPPAAVPAAAEPTPTAVLTRATSATPAPANPTPTPPADPATMTEPPPTTPSPEAAPAATPTARQQYGYGLGDEYGYSDATLAPAPATPTPAPLQIELATDGQHGTYLADADGMALYVFTRDEPGVSNCVGDCAAAWPPLTPPVGETPAAGEGVEGELDVIEREDGSLQITYEGDPLYYYVADGEPGQTNGEGLAGVWFLARP